MEINQPGSHIDHMLRQTRLQNLQLSTMADMKANMLLTVSSLVLGLCLSHLAKDPTNLVFIILAVASAFTITLAIYSAMPKARAFGNKSVDKQSSNFTLLFFGDFINLPYEEFEKDMEVTLNSPSLSYEAQVKEVYNSGVYLAKYKYQKLRYAYLSFLFGVIGAAIIACIQYLRA